MKELVTAQIDNVFFLRWNRNLQNENATWVDRTRVSKIHILSMALNTEHCFFFFNTAYRPHEENQKYKL